MTDQSSISPIDTVPIRTIQMPSLPTLSEIESITAICKIAAQSNFVNSSAPMNNQSQRMADAFFVVMMGRELGISAMMALKTIFVIEGKPSCSGQALLSLMRRAGVEVEIPDPATITTQATVRVRRPGGQWHEYTYTEEMAKQAGLLSRNIWGKYKREMMLWRAVSTANRFETPDITGGMYTIEEIAPPNFEINAEGDVISQVSLPAQASSQAAQTTPLQPSQSNIVIDDPKAWLKDVDYLIQKALQSFEGLTAADIARYVSFTDLKDITDKGWGKYADAKSAGLAIKEGFEADMKKLAESAPATAKAGSPFGTPATPASAPESPWNAYVFADLDTHITGSYYNETTAAPATANELLQGMKLSAWTEIEGGLEEAKKRIAGYAQSVKMPIIANKVKYVTGNKPYYQFSNGFITARLYSRDDVRELGEEWATYAEAWKDGEVHLFAEDEMPNLVLLWETKGKAETAYNAVKPKGVLIAVEKDLAF